MRLSFCITNTTFSRFSQAVQHVRGQFGRRSFATLQVVDKGQLKELEIGKLLEKINRYSKVHLDLGTGDGKYVYRQAKAESQAFFIGVDVNPDGLAHVSWKVARKPSRGGGIANTAFICSSVEGLPSSFCSVADVITINFPWANLLKGIVAPNPSLLRKINSLGKENASIEVLLNYTVFKDVDYLRKKELPLLNESSIRTHLFPAYRECGIELKSYKIESISRNSSSWGNHLTLGNGRDVLSLVGKIRQQHIKIDTVPTAA